MKQSYFLYDMRLHVALNMLLAEQWSNSAALLQATMMELPHVWRAYDGLFNDLGCSTHPYMHTCADVKLPNKA